MVAGKTEGGAVEVTNIDRVDFGWRLGKMYNLPSSLKVP